MKTAKRRRRENEHSEWKIMTIENNWIQCIWQMIVKFPEFPGVFWWFPVPPGHSRPLPVYPGLYWCIIGPTGPTQDDWQFLWNRWNWTFSCQLLFTFLWLFQHLAAKNWDFWWFQSSADARTAGYAPAPAFSRLRVSVKSVKTQQSRIQLISVKTPVKVTRVF